MKRKKNYTLLIIGATMLIAGVLLAVWLYNSSYQESVAKGNSLKEIKAQISAVNEGNAEGDLNALKADEARLTDEKLALERPYSYSLVFVFLAVLLTIRGIYSAVVGVYQTRTDLKRLVQAGLLATLCYIGFAVFKIPLGPGMPAFHFGNVFCVLAALLLGGYWGGLAGAVGMTIADLTTAYVTSAPKTFLLKLGIGLIVGLVAHKICKLSRDHSPRYVAGVTILACVCGMAFNTVADPVVGYFYKTYLLGIPQDLSAALAKMAAVTSAVNAVIAVIAASAFYLALRPALKKAELFLYLSPEDGKANN